MGDALEHDDGGCNDYCDGHVHCHQCLMLPGMSDEVIRAQFAVMYPASELLRYAPAREADIEAWRARGIRNNNPAHPLHTIPYLFWVRKKEKPA